MYEVQTTLFANIYIEGSSKEIAARVDEQRQMSSHQCIKFCKVLLPCKCFLYVFIFLKCCGKANLVQDSTANLIPT